MICLKKKALFRVGIISESGTLHTRFDIEFIKLRNHRLNANAKVKAISVNVSGYFRTSQVKMGVLPV
jgi:hypothetical protein